MTDFLKPLKLSTKNIQVTLLGCQFTGQESKWEVRYVVKSGKLADKALPMILADLYLRYPDIITEEYDPNRDNNGGHYTIGTIMNYASILKHWPIEERHWELGISFYQAACPLPKEQRAVVLDWVVIEGKGRDELRAAVKLLTNGKRPELPPLKDDTIFDQAQQIYNLESQITEYETVENTTDYNFLVETIIRLIGRLQAGCPEKVKLIKEYLDELR